MSVNLNWKITSLKESKKFKGLGQLKEAVLPVGTVVIENEKSDILAIPGISGGQETSVDAKTRGLILEVANFSGEEVARNSFRLSYRSEASRIFAGDINPELTKLLIVRIQQILGDQITINPVLNWQNPNYQPGQNSVQVDFEYLASRLDGQGIEYWKPIIESKLKFLGRFDSASQTLYFNRFYQRIKSQEDLLTELTRLIGFQNLQSQAIGTIQSKQTNSEYKNTLSLKKLALEYGFDEVISRPFVAKDSLLNYDQAVKLVNPSSSLQPFFRDNLITSLLKTLSENIKRGEKNPRIFEINKTYTQSSNDSIQETNNLCLVWALEDAYLGTTIVHDLLAKHGLKYSQSEKSDLLIGQKVSYIQESDTKLELIQISNRLKKQFDLPLNKTVWALNLELDATAKLNKYKTYKDESDFPSINRSYSINIPKSMSWHDLKSRLETFIIADSTINLEPVERIALEKSTSLEKDLGVNQSEEVEPKDKLNFRAEFVSNIRTLNGADIQAFEDMFKQFES